jgi:signal transduction histidine kinase
VIEQLDKESGLAERLHDMAEVQKATFNILEDFIAEREKTSAIERATFNILEDFADERRRFAELQAATLNILADFLDEKARSEEFQKATFNILEDSEAERSVQDSTKQATFNILEDFISERDNLNDIQRAAFNILEDLNIEKLKLGGEIIDRKRAENDLENVNKELESFSYSVSHDLRAPLRGIDGFSYALLTEYGDKLDETGHEYLALVRESSQRMGQLIDDLLNLSRVSQSELHHELVDLSMLCRPIVAALRAAAPERKVSFIAPAHLPVFADTNLTRVVLTNLLGNAWKFTGGVAKATVELGSFQKEEQTVFFVRDNGAGFDMSFVDKLFGAFQRLHTDEEFPGTGIGLATVRRIIFRHGGRIWAEASVDKGATFYFTLTAPAATAAP